MDIEPAWPDGTSISEFAQAHGITKEAAANQLVQDMRALHQPPEIARWWIETAQNDYDAFGPKLAEYGAHDLRELGRKWARLMHWDDIDDAQMAELGCWFYLSGKIERAFEALHRHELPSDDTVHDAVVYGMMVRCIRARGELR